jgi:o-succinylbenzoate---CoA ligase
MPRLVALDLPAGQGFVDALRRTWDAGDAVLPVDPRLPRPAAQRLMDDLRPTAIIDRSGARTLPGGQPAEPGDALVVATSGTTGQPKGVVLTHRAVSASAWATTGRLNVDPSTDQWVACLPLAHIGGLSVVTRAMVTDTPCTLLDRFDADSVEQAARNGATLVSLVATALRRTDVSGYRAVLLGGASPPDSLPSNVVATYGMTETGSGIIYDGLPLDGVEVRIGGGSGGGGGDGEVHVRGPMVMRCYRDGTDPLLPGGWLPTGDSGRLSPDGRLTVFGRIDDVIVTGAEKVWPVAVEEVLRTLSAIADVAVWKRPDAEWGERVVAWIVPADSASPPTLDVLRQAVSAKLAPWAAPKELVLVTTLARTSSGKIVRHRLR